MKVKCISLFCICSIFLLLLLSGCGVTEYSVKDFADITVVGYTEHGTLSIKVNDAAVNRIYADGRRDKTAALRFAETFRFSYAGEDSEDSYFTNGDVVTINVTYDEGMAKDLGISFVDSSFDYSIEGLEDKIEMSPFEGLNVKFSGVAPYGSVQLDKSNCVQYVIDNVTFQCSQYDLSNGDKVVVRAEFNPEIAERNGYVFTEDAKKFTVVGLPKYVTTMMGVNYSAVTARMRYMVEQHIEGTETSYKSLTWYFGDEDTDSELYYEEENTESDASDNESEEDEEGEDELSSESANEEDGENSSSTSSAKKKKKSDVQRIKEDFVLSDFDAKFEYTPVESFYALNPLQYSDNIFISAYKVKGTFKCTATSGSGYIKVGDTVVGELYLTASLTGGSVDIKNNLFYESTTLKNSHAYSIRSFPEYEDMSSDVFKSTTYVVEILSYVEDQDEYDKFAKDRSTAASRPFEGDAHITVPSKSESDSDTSSKKKRSSSLAESEEPEETDTDTELEYEYESETYDYGDDDYSEDDEYEYDYAYEEDYDYYD